MIECLSIGAKGIDQLLVKNTNNGYNAAALCDLSNQKNALK